MQFCEIAKVSAPDLLTPRAIIYSACIIAETIRTDVYDEPHRIMEVIDPKEPPTQA